MHTANRWVRALALCTATLHVAGCARASSTLALTWLANEGVLISVDDQQVLIDAFVPQPYSIYTALPAATAAAMLAGEPPFDDVELALVSHVHRDHLQPDFAARFLSANTNTRLVSSPQVLATLPDGTTAEPRWPAAGAQQHWETGNIAVTFLQLSHGSGRFAQIQNLGHIVEIDGFRVLHIGDAAMDAANFAPYRLAQRELDVALVPYWYFSSTAGRALVDEHLPARLTIAVHIPWPGEDDTNLAAARTAGAVVPERAMQTWTLSAQSTTR